MLVLQNSDAWALLGHLHYLNGKMEDARECYERTLSYVTEATNMHAIYLRLASIYLEKEEVKAFTLFYFFNFVNSNSRFEFTKLFTLHTILYKVAYAIS